jgi:spermidine synthase
VLRDRLLLALAVTCALGTFGLAQAPAVYDGAVEMFGTGMAAALGAEAAVAAAAFLLPCLVMGALFSLLAGMARHSGVGIGRALGVNTLGAALAPALFGVLIAPWLSAKFALLVVAAGYLALGARSTWSRPAPWVIAAGLAIVALLGPSLVIVDVPPDGRLVSHVQGVLSTVSIVEDAEGVATLHIDNRQQEGSSATLFTDGRQAILPLLLHPAPAQALFLGLGTGVTSAVAAREPGVAVTAVELLPEVIDASAHFTEALDRDMPGPSPTLVHADARRFVRSSDSLFDVIRSEEHTSELQSQRNTY